MWRWWGGLLLLLVLAAARPAAAEVPVPSLKARVTDLTQTLSATDSAALDAAIRLFETHSGGQLAVLVVPTTQPESIEQYSLRVVEQWKPGFKGKDNGLLLLVAKQDRKLRIEVGYGLEDQIPDAIARRVIDETITPRFKAGDFAGGLRDGIQRLTNLFAPPAPSTAPVTPDAAAPAPSGPHGIPGSTPAWAVTDLTGRLPEARLLTWSNALNDFYQSDGGDRTKPAFIVVMPTVSGDVVETVAVEALKSWGENDNLDVDRSLLLLIAADDATAAIVTGTGLGANVPAGMKERLISEELVPLLRKGALADAVENGVRGVEVLIDAAHANRPFSERLADELYSVPAWLIVAVIAVGTLVRWLVGPLLGATVMAGTVGGGAWLVAGGDMTAALIAAGVTFVFVLVGLANWLSMAAEGALRGGGGSGGGGGFRGGGGGFGGGGASGSW